MVAISEVVQDSIAAPWSRRHPGPVARAARWPSLHAGDAGLHRALACRSGVARACAWRLPALGCACMPGWQVFYQVQADGAKLQIMASEVSRSLSHLVSLSA